MAVSRSFVDEGPHHELRPIFAHETYRIANGLLEGNRVHCRWQWDGGCNSLSSYTTHIRTWIR